MLTQSLITKEEDFLRLEDEWRTLLPRTPADNIFLTWEWISTWWEVFGKGKQPHILTFRNDDGLVGIFPCHIRSRSLFRLAKIRELRFIGTGESVRSEYLDLICLPGYRQECLEKLAEFLRRDKNWDIAVFTDLPGVSDLAGFLCDRVERCEIINRESCYYVAIPDNFETYLQGIDSRMRRNIRNRRRNLERDFRVEYCRLGKEGNLREWMEIFRLLHSERLKERGLPGKFFDPQYSRFHEKISRIFQESGRLFAADLRLNGIMIAARYNFLYRNTVYDYQTGYAPQYGQRGVMQCLISFIIEECSTEGIKEFDFLAGEEDYKRRFSNQRREVITLRAINSTPWGLIYLKARKLKNNLNKFK